MSLTDDRRLPVVIAKEKARPEEAAHQEDAARPGVRKVPPMDAAYAAQLYGQPGQKRGLRGGAPVLRAARTAYLEAEYSGPYDRRPPQGAIAKTAF
jgi:hypothetical protein